MSKSCSGVLEEYIKCVEASGCVSASGRAVKDCARDSAAVPECAKYRELFVQCKRGQVDMRTRIRGNKGY